MGEYRNLDERRASLLASLCETIVPGSARVQPVLYIDGLMSQMAAGERDAALGCIDALADVADGGPEALRPRAMTPEFLQLRALAVEAFYSDFVAPGAAGPGAYQEIDFNSPLAQRIEKDWSYLGVGA
ncbi:MAG: hypothetical protein JO156_14380 [Solirubrobacterales bacterium]|nr:hypothetical protein [Solirubrobacterales bacterium]